MSYVITVRHFLRALPPTPRKNNRNTEFSFSGEISEM